MATVQCTGCGRAVDARLIVCPDCGTPVGYLGGTPVARERSEANSQRDRYCFEHPDLSREADMRLHAERFSKAHQEDSGLRESRLDHRMPSKQGNTQSFAFGGGGLGLIVCAVVVTLCVLVILYGNRHFELNKQRARWPTTEGRVLSSRISTSYSAYDDAPNGVDVDVKFAYVVKGQTFSATQGWGDSCFLLCPEKEEGRARQYSSGASVLVYYNPSNPSEAVVEPRTGSVVVHLLVTMLSGIIALVAVVWFLGIIKGFWD